MPAEALVRIAGSCGAGMRASITTVYLPVADTLNPDRMCDGLPLRLTSRLSEKMTSADVSGGTVSEVHVPPQLEREALAGRARPGLDEQRHRVRKIVLFVREKRVVYRSVDDVRGRRERPVRVARVEDERVVDDERGAVGGAAFGAGGGAHASDRTQREERQQPACAPFQEPHDAVSPSSRAGFPRQTAPGLSQRLLISSLCRTSKASTATGWPAKTVAPIRRARGFSRAHTRVQAPWKRRVPAPRRRRKR